MAEVKVRARGLTKRYGSHVAVDGLSLEVRAGEIVGLLGPNGAGKTTAIEIMEGLRKPDSGSCQICGFDVLGQAREVRRRIGLSLQSANMPAYVTVKELIRLYASLYPNPVPVDRLLDQFELREKARSICTALSGGQKQRLALALALVGRPEVVFLDEPTTGLDPQARHNLWDTILTLKEGGQAVLISTHYMDEAQRLCDRVLIMDRGRIIAQGSPLALIREHCPQSSVVLGLSGASSHLSTLSRLPSVTAVESDGPDQAVVSTTDIAQTLTELAHYARERQIRLDDLHVRSATLEDVFITLTGRRLRA